MKTVFEYTNYRDFLNDWCTARKKESATFSFRNFSRQVGISSPSFLKMVIDGKRNLAPDTIIRFAKVLKLKAAERRFFENLVLFNQAKTNAEKNHYYKRISRNKRFREANHLTHERFEYFNKWYYAAIREMVVLPDFDSDPAWIAKRLKPRISRADVEAAIETLIKLGMLVRGEDGRLCMSEDSVGTADDVSSLALTNFHRAMIERAGESLSLCKGKNRSVSSLTVAMSKNRFKKVKDRINEFRKELRSLLEQSDDPEHVYQINFQLFSLTEEPNEA